MTFDRKCSEDVLIHLGGCISSTSFRTMPDTWCLDRLCDGARSIEIHLPLNEPFVLTDEEGVWTHHVHTACLETDQFCDSRAIDHFSNLRTLRLVLGKIESEYLDHRDISDMQLAIFNLSHLETMELHVGRVPETLIQQLAQSFIFPSVKFDARLVIARSRTRRRGEVIVLSS